MMTKSKKNNLFTSRKFYELMLCDTSWNRNAGSFFCRDRGCERTAACQVLLTHVGLSRLSIINMSVFVTFLISTAMQSMA